MAMDIRDARIRAASTFVAASDVAFSSCRMSRHSLMISCASPDGVSAFVGYIVLIRLSNADKAAASIVASDEYMIWTSQRATHAGQRSTHLCLDTFPELLTSLPNSCSTVDRETLCHRLHQVSLHVEISSAILIVTVEELTIAVPAAVENFSKKSGMAILANSGDADMHCRNAIFRSSAVIP